MKPSHVFIAARALALVSVWVIIGTAPVEGGTTPLGPGFSYQGQLQQAGVPYNGTADFRFTLWEVSAGAPQVVGTGTWSSDNVTVADGVFSTDINFGAVPQAFDGNARWLEIRVRTPHDPTNTQPFTTLTPRQKISAVPYAQYALNANTPFVYSSSNAVFTGGNVGIGTAAPGAKLDVQSAATTSNASAVLVTMTSPASNFNSAAVRGINMNTGTSFGVWGTTSAAGSGAGVKGDGLIGVLGSATGTSGFNAGVAGESSSPQGYAGWFNGRGLFTDSVNVGGNFSPAARLTVRKSLSGVAGYLTNDVTMVVESDTFNFINMLAPDAAESGLLFGRASANPRAAIAYNNAAAPDGLQFRTGGNTTRMTLDSAGRLGVGTVTPQQALSISGGMNLDQANGNAGTIASALSFGSSSGEAIGSRRTAGSNQFGLDFYTASQPRMAITNGGFVGIGTANPATGLHLEGGGFPGAFLSLSSIGGSGDSGLRLSREGTVHWHFFNAAASGDALSIHNSSFTPVLAALQSGDVGIGTAAPGTRLHVVSSNGGQNTLQAVNSAAAGTGAASGIVGLTNQASAAAGGVRGGNLATLGTGVIGSGNTQVASTLAFGSGGAFTGWTTGVYARSNQTGSSGEGLYAEQNGTAVRVAYWNGATFFKINGTGVVSTIVRDVEDRPVTMFAPEAPEVLLQDFGQGMLIDGFAHIELDPIFARNVLIDETHPLRVFIQLEDNENCQGVIVKNKNASGFDVLELRGGRSNTPFQYQITCNRADETLAGGRVSHYADVRFPPAAEPVAPLTAPADPAIGVATAPAPVVVGIRK